MNADKIDINHVTKEMRPKFLSTAVEDIIDRFDHSSGDVQFTTDHIVWVIENDDRYGKFSSRSNLYDAVKFHLGAMSRRGDIERVGTEKRSTIYQVRGKDHER